MSWAKDARNLLIAAIAFALLTAAIVAASLSGSGAAAPLAPFSDAGIAVAETGTLTIIKQPIPGNASGPWTFTWVCNDNAGTNGSAIYPDDFGQGKQFEVPTSIVLGTVCQVTESGDLDTWDVSYQVEAGQFTDGNVADVRIDNSQGNNTVKFKNTQIEPEVGEVWIEKQVVAPDAQMGATFPFQLVCGDDGGPGNGIQLGNGDSFHAEDLPIDLQCFAAEHVPGDQWLVTATLNGSPAELTQSEGGYIGVRFTSWGRDTIVITNCYLGDPYFSECTPIFNNQ